AVWLMLHSGSRNVGKTIGECATHMARQIAQTENRHLPDRDLAWLDEGSPEFNEYVEGLGWAQNYAATNREIMLTLVIAAVSKAMKREVEGVEEPVNWHHNYASLEEHFGERLWITRKGAVSARAGELGIIPGSMGAKSFIVRGKGNADSYSSCSHGAGRKMSRGEAKRRFSVDDLTIQTDGVECRKDKGVIDEIPAAYKDIDEVMSAQSDLVEVVDTLKQVLCVTGCSLNRGVDVGRGMRVLQTRWMGSNPILSTSSPAGLVANIKSGLQPDEVLVGSASPYSSWSDS